MMIIMMMSICMIKNMMLMMTMVMIHEYLMIILFSIFLKSFFFLSIIMGLDDESNVNNADDVSVLLMSLSSRQTEIVISRYYK